MVGKLSELYEYREVAFWLAVRQIKSRYKQTLLGGSWAVLQPFATMVVFTLIFGRLAGISSDGIPYPIFSFSALVFWTFFTTCVNAGTASLVSNSNLIRKIYFPRETLLLAAMATALVDLAISLTVFGGMMWYFRVPLHETALMVVPLLLLQIVFTFGVICTMSSLNVFFRDIGHALPLITQLWMFASPIAYPLSAVPARFKGLYLLNPFAGLIEGYRDVLLRGIQPEPRVLAYTAVVCFAMFAVGYAFFKRTELSFADVI